MDKTNRSMAARYDAFEESAVELLNEAGFGNSNDSPNFVGRAFYEACVALVTAHFPEDREFGKGPRGILRNMYKAVSSEWKDKPDPDPVNGAQSIAFALRNIISTRPPLDLETKGRSTASHELSAHKCPFLERDRNYQMHKYGVFVLMPFSENWSDRLWNDHIKEYLRSTPNGDPLSVQRADDMFGQGVMEDIFEGIVRSRLIIAECTGKNPNVLYELGIAHSLGKRTALLSQNVDDIPFDLQRFRFCIYEDNSSGYPRLETFLHQVVRETFYDAGL